MMLLELPVDIWFSLMENLSLGDLGVLYTALATTPFDLSHIKEFAVNTISRILVSDSMCTSSHATFAYNGPCYKLTRKLPRAAASYHEKVHGQDPPCGGEYTYTFEHSPALRFLPAIKLSRMFRSTANDKRTTEMTLLSNHGKPFDEENVRWFRDRPDRENTGPRELVMADFAFSSSSDARRPILRFRMDTLGWVDIINTYTDVPQYDVYVKRTAAHVVPLQKIMWEEWVEGRWKSTELPREWYEFWSSSGIRRGVGTFSKKRLVGADGDITTYGRWKMESFKSEWKIPMPLSSCVEVVELDI
jgi:hypothetical protein